MLVMIRALDGLDAPTRRVAALAAHLDFVAAEIECIRVAGPLLDAAGDKCGSLYLIEAADIAAAERWLLHDPYAQAGVWSHWEMAPFQAAAGTWVGGLSWQRP